MNDWVFMKYVFQFLIYLSDFFFYFLCMLLFINRIFALMVITVLIYVVVIFE